jgi:hypothetical protein
MLIRLPDFTRTALITGVIALLQSACTSEPPTQGAPAEMRRLTAEQYRNVVHDVFGDHIVVAGRFDPLVRTEGLFAVGARNAPITPAGFEQFYNVARSVASQVVADGNRRVLLPCQPVDAGRADGDCAGEFVTQIGRLLYRRPLTAAEVDTAVASANRVADELKDFYQGIEFSLTGMLVSPSFLFIVDSTQPDPETDSGIALTAHAKASRLSFLLWNTGPDPQLLAAAESGELDTRKGLEQQVQRLLGSPLLERGIRAFFSDFLDLEKFETMEKDTTIYPAYTITAAESAREQLLLTVVDHVMSRDAPYPELFTTNKTFLNPSLGRIYRVPVARPDGGWQPHEFAEDDPRAGILTQMGFLALYSHPGRSSATLRGAAVRELVLCHNVPDPPGDVDFSVFTDPDSPSRTARDRLTAHATVPSCAGCHKLTDPLGLGFEQFDGIGQFRTEERGATIDPSGDLDGVSYADARQLTETIQNHPDVPSCLTNQLYAYAGGRAPVRSEKEFVTYLTNEFADDGYRITALLEDIATSDAFYRVTEQDAPAEPVRSASNNDPAAQERGS